MLIVIDTNILLISLKSNTKYSVIFDNLILGKFDIAISNEILFEYIELIERKINSQFADKVINMLIALPNAHFYEPFFKWNLISKDESDNKFVDCAIIGGADYIVTNDKHFNTLKQIDFPKVNVISIDEFIKILES